MNQFLSSFAFPVLSLFYLLLLDQSTFVSISIIEETCYRCAKTDPNLDYDYCVNLLYSDPNSRNADLSGLGVISLGIAGKKAAGVRSFVQKLLKSIPVDKKYRQCLEDCLELYTDAVSELSDSVGAIKSARIDDARTWISAAFDAAGTCEDGFKEGRFSSPVTKQNQDYTDTVVIPLAIAALLDSK